MLRRIGSLTGLIPLALLGWLLSAEPVAAQNQGYSVWYHRNDGGTGSRSRSSFVPQRPTYYDSSPAFAGTAPAMGSQSYYYGYYHAPSQASPANDTVTINVTVPADDAKILFGGSMTVQRGKQRQFVSPPLQPGQEYTYDIQVNWKQDGREVTRNRRITIHAGDVVNLTFPLG